MSASHHIDFQAIKAQVSIVQILEHYELMNRLTRNGEIITGTCPIHENNRHIAFRANTTINCWNCFNQCGCSGDIIDLVSRKERVSAQKAARLIMSWFGISFELPAPALAEAPMPQPQCMPARPLPADSTDSNLPLYSVKRYWELCDSVLVRAKSPADAIEIAHELPLESSKAEYVSDSLNSDPETDVAPIES